MRCNPHKSKLGRNHRRSKALLGLAAASGAMRLLMAGSVQASSLFWTGASTAGTASSYWSTTNNIWGTSSGTGGTSSPGTAAWINPDDATFEGTAATVLLGSTITAGNVTLDGYTINLYNNTTAYNMQLNSISGSGTITNSKLTANSATLTLTPTGNVAAGLTVNGNVALTLNASASNYIFPVSYAPIANATSLTVTQGVLQLTSATTTTGRLQATIAGTLDLNAQSAYFWYLTGSGLITNSNASPATLNANLGYDETFTGTISGNIVLARAGKNLSISPAVNDSSLTVQNGVISSESTIFQAANTTVGAVNFISGVSNGTYSGQASVQFSANSATTGAISFGTTDGATNGSGDTTQVEFDGTNGAIAGVSFANNATSASANAYGVDTATLKLVGNNTIIGNVDMSNKVKTTAGNASLSVATLQLLGAAAQVGSLTNNTAPGTGYIGGTMQILLGNTTGSGTASTLTLNPTANSSFYGQISDGTATAAGAIGNLVKIGTYTQTFAYTANTYTGTTTIKAGSLALTNNASIGNSSLIAIGNAATFDVSALTGGNYTVPSGQNIAGFGNGTATFKGSLLLGGRTLDLQSYDSDATLTNFSVTGNAALNSASLKFDLGATAGSNDKLSIGGAVTVTGTNTLYVNALSGLAALAYGNYTLVSATTNAGGGSYSLGNSTITVGSTLYNLSLTNSTTTAEILTVSYGGSPTWTGASTGAWDTSSANWITTTGSTYADGMSIIFDDTGNNTNPVNITSGGVNPGALTFNNSGKTYAFTGGQIGGASTTVTLNGNGTVLLLNGVNTYGGNTTINAGTLQLGNGTSGFDAAVAGNITNNAALVYNLYGNQTYAGVISGNGTVAKASTGALTFASANTYSGGTTVTSGTLAVTNASGSATGTGNVNMNGGTLGGSGTMAPTGTSGTLISIASGAQLAPSLGTGNSTTTLHANVSSSSSPAAFNIADGAVFSYNFAAPGTSDLLAVTGNVTLAGNDTLNINQLSGFGAGNYTLISATNLTDTVGNWTLPSSTQYVYAVVGNSTALVLDVTPSGPVTLIWNGNNTASWDTTSNNWQGSARYVDGDLVVFADILLGNFTVDLGNATFTPGAVTVNNSNSAYTIGNGSIGGNATLTKNGTNTLTVTGANTYSGGTTVNAGTLDVATASNGLLAGSSVVNYANLQFDGAQTLGMIAGNGTTTVSGTGSLTVNNISQASLVNNGAVLVNGTGTVATLSDTSGLGSAGNTTVNGNLTVTSFAQASLINNGTTNINGTGTIGQLTGTGNLTIGNGSLANTVMLATAATPGVLGGLQHTQGSITIASASRLDITNNALLLNYGSGASPLAVVANAVAFGAGIGNNSGNGAIISSTVNNGAAGKYAVGYADHTEISTVPTGNVEVAYTLAGDANLDGSVDILDYQQMAPHYDEAGVYDWSQGDFNHDGHVDILDYQAMAPNYDTKLTAGTLIGADSLTASTSLTAADLAKPIGGAVAAADLQASEPSGAGAINPTDISAVPEPATLSLLLLGGIPLLGRRRRV